MSSNQSPVDLHHPQNPKRKTIILVKAVVADVPRIRHRVVRERNTHLRKATMNRVCGRARHCCSAVETSAAHLSKCQGVVQVGAGLPLLEVVTVVSGYHG